MSKEIITDAFGKPLTGAQAYKRKDGKYGWRFVVEGNIRYFSADPFDTREEARADFIELSRYRAAPEEEIDDAEQ